MAHTIKSLWKVYRKHHWHQMFQSTGLQMNNDGEPDIWTLSEKEDSISNPILPDTHKFRPIRPK